MTSDTYSVLVVTKDTKISSLVSAILIPPLFELSVCTDFNEARRKCGERNFNIVLVDFAEGEGTDFAIDISDSLSTILLLSPSQHFDQISYKVEPYGVLTLTSPFDQFYFYNMIKVAIAVQYKVQVLSSKATQLKEKMEEIKRQQLEELERSLIRSKADAVVFDPKLQDLLEEIKRKDLTNLKEYICMDKIDGYKNVRDMAEEGKKKLESGY